MALSEDFLDHLQSGLTTLARCWLLRRKDGWVRGFTDHDTDVVFAGVTFRADTGLTAHALMQTTGLAIDNTEALGALSDASVTEADIRAGRFDGAEVEAWLVNWANPDERLLQFRGSLGEITRSGGAFRAELLGLTETLNRPQGRVYQSACSAVLGDGRCGFDTNQPGFSEELAVVAIEDDVRFTLDGADEQPERWFEKGRFAVLDGGAAGLVGVIKNDGIGAGGRVVELWQALRAPMRVGDRVRIEAGCDKRHQTCRDRFDNIVNFRGFPHIPGEDRLLSVPVQGTTVDETGGGK
ncbi:DUF2163 domain-containing protein [uncultured Maritimibacter sp.]|uniref:DUF2163 domain-containing protein n=1 Tax=uncultured Maritimibacter sp. TaxID=991866 RepID=UPI0025988EF6|nr:DUF2163 domain-containing protein [uncultured Maritimibacter sp.]